MSSNSHGAVYFACLSGRSYLHLGERSIVTAVPTERNPQNVSCSSLCIVDVTDDFKFCLLWHQLGVCSNNSKLRISLSPEAAFSDTMNK